MSSILAPPVQGGRVYEGRTWNWLEATARSRDSYDRIHRLTAEIADGWTSGLRARLATQGIHVLGVEAFVDGDVPDPPFPGVTGPIGVAVFWLTTGPDASDGEPEVYAFARQGAAGVEPFAADVVAASIRGAFYVAMNTGDATTSSAESWCIATHGVQRSDRGLLSGEFVANTIQNGLQLRCFERGWAGFGTDLHLARVGNRVDVRYERGRYEHFEWLLSELGLVPAPAGAPAGAPAHRTIVGPNTTRPAWAPGPGRFVSGSFSVSPPGDPAAEEAALRRYDAARGQPTDPAPRPLWYGIETTDATRQADIRRLQADLWNLGFWITEMIAPAHRPADAFTPGRQHDLDPAHATGTYDRHTVWAVREFQIYAGMDHVAAYTPPGAGPANRHVDNLTGQVLPADRRYSGHVTGVLDGATALALQHWRDNDYRCPVVVEARSGGPNYNALDAQNLWLPSDHANTGPRMFTYDVSRHVPVQNLPAARLRFTRADGTGSVVSGDYATYLRWHGPRSTASHCIPEGELTPQNLTGLAPAAFNANAAMQSTYRVVHAVSRVECYGQADSVNAYDNAVVSVGPCHWTYTLDQVANDPPNTPYPNPAAPVGEGELPGTLSYLQATYPAAFGRHFGRFGVDVDTAWGANGGTYFKAGQRKYGGRLRLRYRDPAAAPAVSTPSSSVRGRDRDYFRTWHWFHRLENAGRFGDDYRRCMWDMARIRLRDIRETPFPAGTVPNVGGPGGRTARIGDVFASERAMALLLRLHVRAPASVIGGGNATGHVVQTYNAVRNAPPAGVNAGVVSGDPSAWPTISDYGEAFIDALISRVPNPATLNINGPGVAHTNIRPGEDFYRGPGWARLDSGGQMFGWRGVAATNNPVNSIGGWAGVLLTLTRVLTYNHPALGQLDTDHGSLEFAYDGLPGPDPAAYPYVPVLDPR